MFFSRLPKGTIPSAADVRSVAGRRGRASRPRRLGLIRIASGAFAALSVCVLVSWPHLPVQARGPVSVAPVAEKLVDAVVNISTSQLAKGPQGVPLPNVPKGSPFEEFFDDFFNERGGPGVQRKVNSLGSGFVIDGKEGLVVTNNHVIADADEIIVNFADGSKLTVDKVLGRDAKTDLALLKVTPKKPLVQVNFGSSEVLRVGDWVMAIGNPFGLGGSVSVGIISAKQRDINSGPYDDYLQTDAAINKGNSGGPLFNMDGDVIGVNTAIISPTGGSIGIGFAVPSDVALNVINQFKEFGETRRGWLGVKIQSVTEDIAATLGVEENTGALVAGVDADSPAKAGGIEPGDVIVKFDGKVISSMRGLPRVVAQTPIGEDVDVEVLRKGEKMTLRVKVARLDESDPDAGRLSAPGGGDPGQGEVTPDGLIGGLTLRPLDDELRKSYGLSAKISGVVVTKVEDNSAAAKKGLKIGDVIVEVAQAAVTSLEDVQKNVERVVRAGRRAVLLRIEDNKGETRFVAVPLN